jgi:hypothetical protein
MRRRRRSSWLPAPTTPHRQMTHHTVLCCFTAGLRIEELFRPHVNTVPIFAAVGADPKALYTQQQAAEVCD